MMETPQLNLSLYLERPPIKINEIVWITNQKQVFIAEFYLQY